MIARRHSVDLLAEKYFNYSPYNYVVNNPIIYIDTDGNKVVFANGSSDSFKANFGAAVKHLNKNGADGMLASLQDSDKTYIVSETGGVSSYATKTKTISWNSTQGLLTNNLVSLSPTSVLNHEIDHALQHDQNPDKQKTDGKTQDAKYDNKEEKRVIEGSEQETAKKLGEIRKGETTRTNHGGTTYETTGPTKTERKNEIIITPKKIKEDEN